jgi:uncharacterized protein YlxW (UPF0749 family)
MPNETLLSFFRWSVAPLWVIALTVLGLAVKIYPAILARINERRRDQAAEKAGDWTRLRDEVGRLAERVKALEEKVEVCERERDEAKHQLASERAGRLEAEAMLMARQRSDQDLQRRLSAEREAGNGGSGK